MSALALVSPLRTAIAFEQGTEGFGLVRDGVPVALCIDSGHDHKGVVRAAHDLAADFGRVCGTPAGILPEGTPLPRRFVLVGTLGRNPLIDRLVADGRLSNVVKAGQWESYLVQTVTSPFPGVDEILVIAGSDKRGTMYGIYDLSLMLGVSPWYWWADVPTQRRDNVHLQYGAYHQGPPSVRYRGIFLNNEAPALTAWTQETFGGMNAAFYTRVFELLLRLRANYLWPAMWNNAFAEDDPDNARLADEYGIVMGTSHHEPMMRAHKEWTARRDQIGNGEWKYATNREPIKEFFREGIKRNRGREVLVTIGMRGDGDVVMTGTGSLQSDVDLIETIITDQRDIIAEEIGVPADRVPQVWVLFTEVQKYYDAGLKVPDDVTIMFSDDNVGNLRRLPTDEERQRSGGFGIYFHMDMHGGPFAYKWLNSNPLPKIWEQMNLAHAYGANEIWIANVGDLKPLEIPIEFFIAMAWNADSMGPDTVSAWTAEWAERTFGKAHANEIASLVAAYAKYNAWRKPELVIPDTYSLETYREAERVADAWESLRQRAVALNENTSDAQRDAYDQLVLFPIQACANLTQMNVAAARNRRFAEQARASTEAEAQEVRRRFALDHELRDHFNHEIAGGKWNHMMDQPHIGAFDWYPPPSDIMPAVAAIDIPNTAEFGVAVDGDSRSWPSYYLSPDLPVFDRFLNRTSWFEVFPRGLQPIAPSVESETPWIRLREGKAFSAGRHDRRFWVDVDWSVAPPGESKGTIIVKDAETEIRIGVTALNATDAQVSAARGAYASLGPAFSIPASGFTRNVAVDGIAWKPIEDYGRVKAAMSVFPVTAPSFTDPAKAPRLEYPVYFAEAGIYQIDLVTGPTLQVNPMTELAVAVSVGNGPIQVQSVFSEERRESEQFLGAAHDENVRNNVRTMRFDIPVDRPGRQVLNVMMIDPTLVLQQIMISNGGLPPSYFGPPEAELQS